MPGPQTLPGLLLGPLHRRGLCSRQRWQNRRSQARHQWAWPGGAAAQLRPSLAPNNAATSDGDAFIFAQGTNSADIAGYTVTTGLPLGPDGNAITPTLPNGEGPLPTGAAVTLKTPEQIEQEQYDAITNESIPPGVEVIPLRTSAPAPAPIASGLSGLGPASAPSAGQAPSSSLRMDAAGASFVGSGRRLSGLFDGRPRPKPPLFDFKIPATNPQRISVTPPNGAPRYVALSPDRWRLFAGEALLPRVVDVDQDGGLGHCWVLSALASGLGAGYSPEIRQMNSAFTSFEVTFFARNRRAVVATNNEVLFWPNNRTWSEDTVVDGSDFNIAWPLIYTKAFTQLVDAFPEFSTQPENSRGYAKINGGLSFNAIYAQTGAVGTRYNFAHKGRQINNVQTARQDIYYINNVLSAPKPIATLSSLDDRTVIENYPNFNPRTRAVGALDGRYVLQIVNNDVYSVRDTQSNRTIALPFAHAFSLSLPPSSGFYMVRNPWGRNHRLTSQNKLEYASDPFLPPLNAAMLVLSFDSIDHKS